MFCIGQVLPGTLPNLWEGMSEKSQRCEIPFSAYEYVAPITPGKQDGNLETFASAFASPSFAPLLRAVVAIDKPNLMF
jgi:hypothetical protein